MREDPLKSHQPYSGKGHYTKPCVLDGLTVGRTRQATLNSLCTEHWYLSCHFSSDSTSFAWVSSKWENRRQTVTPPCRHQDLNAQSIPLHRRPMVQSQSQNRKGGPGTEGNSFTLLHFASKCLSVYSGAKGRSDLISQQQAPESALNRLLH